MNLIEKENQVIFKKENRVISQEELLEHFEVEELENRLEFASWSAEVEGGYNDQDGKYIKATLKIGK